MKTVYLCDSSIEGILSGVYTAWASKKGHDNVMLRLKDDGITMELFCQYEEVPIDSQKSDKVIAAIRTKISEEAYEVVYKAALSNDLDRADKIYRFLIWGFHTGASIVSMLQIQAVYDIFHMCRFVDNETHHLTGFVRFLEMEGDLLVSQIGPKNDIIVLLAPHFADRLSGENWVIYDANRKKAVLHPAFRPWYLTDFLSPQWEDKITKSEKEDEYEDLFRRFRKSISIKERTNPVCQLNHMPLRFRPYMPEFSNGIRDV
ncbi:DNA metabolism protein [Lacrimispora amygdalina]|uniref:DNA metabolism protein n=1 Tax=Lacrimispora amygdalina TaxID=253257 RepID=A0A3E2N8W3_9FIRM|nr:TIGR03915 family putative DNA repair protein [Clostridium indicum]RFZ77443.1 DNA metabolism protein [Clostridium indicum]